MTKLEGIKKAFAEMLNNSGVCFHKQISANTLITVNCGTIKVRLHDTTVFEYNSNSGKIILRTGGWLTNTTRNTINTAFAACNLNYSVSFAKGCFNVSGVENISYNNYAYSFAA